MSRDRSEPSRYRSLRASGRSLARAAPWVQYGLFSMGVSLFLDQVRPLLSDAQFTWGERRVMAVVAVVTLGGAGLTAWVVGQLLRAAGEFIEVFIDGAEAAVNIGRLIETQLAPSLIRVAAALEQHPPAPPPGDPTADEWLARLDAARIAEEPRQVLDCRDALTRHLRGAALVDLDRRVARWLARLVQRRIHAGEASPTLAATVARAIEDLGDNDESLALRDALPELRRRAGLCPECAQPVTTLGQICPACRAAARSVPTPRPRNTP